MNTSKLFLYCIFALIIFSCTENEDFLPIENSSIDLRNRDLEPPKYINPYYTVLGNIRKIPYQKDVVQDAYKEVYGVSAPELSITHTYIRLMPNDTNDLAILDNYQYDIEVGVYDYPLEYEVKQMGEKYLDPDAQDTLFTYQYSCVPISKPFPNCSYEILAELIILKDDPLLEAYCFVKTGNAKDVNDYVLCGGYPIKELIKYPPEVIEFFGIDCTEEEIDCPKDCELVIVLTDEVNGEALFECICLCDYDPPVTNTAQNDCGCPIPNNQNIPAGCVRVLGDLGIESVNNITVRLKDAWFHEEVISTNAQGCWRSNETYNNKVWVKNFFNNGLVRVRDLSWYSGTKIVSDPVLTLNNPPYNNIDVLYDANDEEFSPERRYWAAAHTLNTVFRYNQDAANNGIPVVGYTLNWRNRQGNGAASAPMLQLINGSDPSTLADIINRYDSTLADDDGIEGSRNFNTTAVHELGHASHYAVAGELYWIPFRSHIVANNGYGTFPFFSPTSFPGHVALGEAFGFYIGAMFGFDANEFGNENREWLLDNNGNPSDRYIPAGLLWDLEDNIVDNVFDINNPAINTLDNVEGFTPAMFFNALDHPFVTNIRTFRDNLNTLHMADTPNNINDYNTLVDTYDVFN